MADIVRGDAALRRLSDPGFRSAWMTLRDACPWGTVYQEPAFVSVWYRAYDRAYEPLVVSETDAAGALSGALFLGVCRRSGRLVSCGAEQAEYDAWLATPARATAFLEAACAALRRVFPYGRLQFLFLPPGAPTAVEGAWQRRAFLRTFARPLLSTGPEATDAQASLRKKGNKSKISQLQRLGPVTFSRVLDPGAFDALLSEMIPIFDARQATLNGAPPFASDPARPAFFREMFRAGLLHVTSMRVGERLAAAHIGHINGRQVVLGLIAHSPFLAKYSVGKFQMLWLAVLLQQEGFDAFDLTPAGDYKDRFATHSDNAHVLTICLSRFDAERYRLTRAAIDSGKRYASTDAVKAALDRTRHEWRLLRTASLPGLAATLNARRTRGRGPDVFIRPLSGAAAWPPSGPLGRDRLEDLLRYQPHHPGDPSLGDFMKLALGRLGDGQHVHTRVTSGRLSFWAWTSFPAGPPDTDASGTSLPAGTVVISDWHIDAAGESREALREALLQVTADAATLPGARQVAVTGHLWRAWEDLLAAAGFVRWVAPAADEAPGVPAAVVDRGVARSEEPAPDAPRA